MDDKVRAWRAAGKHLPGIFKDFHDQKDVFMAMHELIGPPRQSDIIKPPSWIDGQCYVIDYFLWFMARHGYTLQKSRSNLNFDSLADNIKAIKAHRVMSFNQMLNQKSYESPK